MSFGMIVLTSFLLGVVHGVTPDEHTWPITFSYAVGSYSARKGFLVGLIFSLSFTVQRALMSEVSYFALGRLFSLPFFNYAIYIVVGAAMAFGGLYVFRFKNAFHIHFGKIDRRHHESALKGEYPDVQAPTPAMAILHGFIAGFGFGAFALIIYTVLAPSMPNAYLGWVPGFFFGIGTTVVQAFAGLFFGAVTRRLKIPRELASKVSSLTAGRTLLWGGITFIAAGAFGLIFPKLAEIHIRTPLHIHNLHSLGLEFVLVIVVVLFIGIGSLVAEIRKATALYKSPSEGSGPLLEEKTL
jgi:sulfite exporter TauE/SafE